MNSNELLVIYGDSPRNMVNKILNESGLERELEYGYHIGIKPNLVLDKDSASGATTRPELVAGIIEFLQENNFYNLVIMESSWVGCKTGRAFETCGYNALGRKYNVPLVDLKKDSTRTVQAGGMDIEVAESVLQLDYLINVPVLKAHGQARLTCALKNLKGCIPDREKRGFHARGLHRPIACLNSIIKTNLVIVDGITGDLNFEEGGTPVQMNRVIAGKDPVLVDTYAGELLGYAPEEINYIKLAEAMEISSASLAGAEITEYRKDLRPQKNLVPGKKAEELARWIKEKEACSACYGSLLHALERLREKGKLDRLETALAIGQGYHDEPPQGPGIGNCTGRAAFHVPGCPPRAGDIVRQLEKYLDNMENS